MIVCRLVNQLTFTLQLKRRPQGLKDGPLGPYRQSRLFGYKDVVKQDRPKHWQLAHQSHFGSKTRLEFGNSDPNIFGVSCWSGVPSNFTQKQVQHLLCISLCHLHTASKCSVSTLHSSTCFLILLSLPVGSVLKSFSHLPPGPFSTCLRPLLRWKNDSRYQGA